MGSAFDISHRTNEVLHKRVVSAGMERMAFGYPQHSQVSSFQHTVFLKGLAGIVRACGIETAGRRQERGNQQLI